MVAQAPELLRILVIADADDGNLGHPDGVDQVSNTTTVTSCQWQQGPAATGGRSGGSSNGSRGMHTVKTLTTNPGRPAGHVTQGEACMLCVL